MARLTRWSSSIQLVFYYLICTLGYFQRCDMMYGSESIVTWHVEGLLLTGDIPFREAGCVSLVDFQAVDAEGERRKHR